jgi:glutathione S-transferase
MAALLSGKGASLPPFSQVMLLVRRRITFYNLPSQPPARPGGFVMLKLYGFSVSNYYNMVKLALLEKGLPFEGSGFLCRANP